MLQGEHAEGVSLAAEIALLAAELEESMAALERLQVQNAQAEQESAMELPMLRCAFRKRCREGYSNAMRLSCSLSVLEGELDQDEPQQVVARPGVGQVAPLLTV